MPRQYHLMFLNTEQNCRLREALCAGFDTNRRAAKVELVLKNKDDLIDVFLGLKEAELTRFEESETRFGITLPVPPVGRLDKVFKISPIPLKTGLVRFRDKDFSNTAAIPVEIIVPVIPGLTFEERKCIIRSSFFELVIHGHAVSFTTTGSVAGKKKLSDWINFLRMRHILSSGSGQIVVELDDSHHLNLKIDTPESDPSEILYLLKAAESLESIAKITGWIEPEIELDELLKSAPMLLAINDIALAKPENNSLALQSDLGNCGNFPEKVQALFVNYVLIGNKRITFSAVANLRPSRGSEKIIWQSEKIDLVEIATVADVENNYKTFLTRAMAQNPFSHKVFADPETNKLVDEGF